MLHRFQATHFRNYEQLRLELSPGINAFIGANGQGKTNLLEAVHFLSLLRSFRTTRNALLPLGGTGDFFLYGEADAFPEGVVRLGVRYGSQRLLMVDGQNVLRSSEFISRLLCVPFLPEDLAIIKGPPGLRRRFLDIALCQLSPLYLRAYQDFHEALKSRNAMLKTPGRYPRAAITAYDQILVEKAAIVEEHRRDLGEELHQALQKHSPAFFPDGRTMACTYLSGIGKLLKRAPDSREKIQESYARILEESFERDCREGMTHYGPQRSDLACLLQGKLLVSYGSEGECRTAALTLRLALLHALRSHHRHQGITILVDDVLGELDTLRKQAFLNFIAGAGQVLFAGTALPRDFPDPRVFVVENGAIRE
ncbi:MAG: DNA replication/repair protein RecF [Oligosphaeraceae bacterium]